MRQNVGHFGTKRAILFFRSKECRLLFFDLIAIKAKKLTVSEKLGKPID